MKKQNYNAKKHAEKMTELRKFYNEEYKMPGTPKFENISEKYLKKMYYGTPFSNWKLRKAIEDLKKTIGEKLLSEFNKIKNKPKPPKPRP